MPTYAESAVGAPEPVVPPEPVTLPVSTGQPTSPSVDLDAIAEKVVSRLDGLLDKKLQSTKDKRFADLEKVKHYLDDSGGDVAKATRQMQLDQLLEQQASKPEVPGRTDGEDFQPRYEKALTELGIAPNDPDLAAISSRGWASKDAFLAALPSEMLKAKNRKAKQDDQSAAGIVSEGGGNPPGTPSQEKLLQDYAAEMYAARGDRAKLRAIKAKFQSKGLPVEQVVLP